MSTRGAAAVQGALLLHAPALRAAAAPRVKSEGEHYSMRVKLLSHRAPLSEVEGKCMCRRGLLACEERCLGTLLLFTLQPRLRTKGG